MKRSARLVLVTAFVAGCATAGESTKGPVVSAKELPRTIAVLPLIPPADPDKEEPARVVTRMIHGSLSATPYDVLKLQLVEERLVRAGLGDPRAAQAKEPAELAKILKVDGIVYGELTHWNRIFLGAYAQVASGASIKLVDARNGTVLFERKEVSRSHEGGVPTNPISAAIQLVQSALKLREIELIRASDDLVRALLKGVPTPPPGEARRPPAFAHVLSDGGRLLKVGDVVTVIAQGQPGV
ncbi:MAG: GNA1162 family protein, partial [candidate division NC10 bacterium]